MNVKRNILGRINLVFLVLCTAGVFISLQAFRISVLEGDYWREQGRELTRIDTIEGERGNIYSEGMELLATSLPYFEIRMDTRVVNEELFENKIDSLGASLSKLFKDKSETEYHTYLRNARIEGNRYLLLQRKADYNDLQKIKAFPILNKGKYAGGLIVKQTNTRQYPFKILLKRTLGYLRDNVPAVGLEGSFNNYLEGDRVPQSVYRTNGGDWIPLFDDHEVDAENGKDVHTTIDIRMQDVVESALMQGLKYHNADHGCAVVMEVATGEIKAIANLGVGTDSTYWEKYNYAIGEKSEPGSTFKVAALTALLESGYVTDSTRVELEQGNKKYHDKWMRDASWSPYNEVTLRRAIEISTNVGISKLVTESFGENPAEFTKFLDDMWLTQPTGIEIKGEPMPTIKNPTDQDWSGISLPWMSIGYEVEVTPLQMLTFFNAIANDGQMMKPFLVSKIGDLNSELKTFEPKKVKQICSKKTARLVQSILKGVVEKGTAKGIYKEGISMAGKTGTAKLLKANRKGYSEIYQASFSGFFPADEPVYSCIVMVNAPRQGGYYGGAVAAPIFGKIVERYYSTNVEHHEPLNKKDDGIFTKPPMKNGNAHDIKTIYEEFEISENSEEDANDWVDPRFKGDTLLLAEIPVVENLIPKVEGMGLRDAMYLLEQQGLKVKFKGKGKVVRQEPRFGKRYKPGQAVALELK